MKNFVTIQLFKTFDKVIYYFWVEGRGLSEADAFFARWENNEQLAQDLNLIVA